MIKRILLCALTALCLICPSLYTEAAVIGEPDITLLEALGIAGAEIYESDTFSGEDMNRYIEKLTNGGANVRLFSGDKAVTDREVLSALIKLAGYNRLLELTGDVDGVAKGIGLLENVVVSENATDGKTLAQMMLNLLDVYIGEPDLSDKIEMGSKTLYREKYFKLYRSKGKLVAIPEHSLYNAEGAAENSIVMEINSREYSFGIKKEMSYLDMGASEYFYYTDTPEEGPMFLCFEESEDSLLRINPADIESISGNTTDGFTISYESNGRLRKVRTEPMADYIYNSVADSAVQNLALTAEKIMSCYGELILRKNNNVYDTVFVNEYTVMIADSVSPEYGIITDKLSGGKIKVDEEKDYVKIYKNGEVAEMKDISPENTVMLLCATDKSGKNHFIIDIVENNIAEGEVNKLDTDIVMINITEYKKSAYFKKSGKTIPAGQNVLLYLDKYGDVIDFRLYNEGMFYYGYMTGAYIDENEELPVTVKLFDQFGNWVRYPLVEKVATNSGSVRANVAFSKPGYGFTDGTQAIKQLIKYRLNYRGEITNIYIASENDSMFKKGITIEKSANVPSVSGILDVTSQETRMNRLYYSGATTVFAVPDASLSSDADYYDRFRVYTSSYLDAKTLRVTGYDADEMLISRVLLTDAPTSAAPTEGGSVVCVTNVSHVYDAKNAETMIRISYHTASGEESVDIAPSNICYRVAETVLKGDIINISKIGQEANGISRLLSGAENVFAKSAVLDATAFNSDFAGIFGKVLRSDFSSGLVHLADDSDNPYLFNLKGATSVVLVEHGTGSAKTARLSDIQSGDCIYIRYAWKVAKEIIIIREG